MLCDSRQDCSAMLNQHIITEGLKQSPLVMSKSHELLQVLQEYIDEFEMDDEGLSDDDVQLIKYVTPRKNLMKMLYDDGQKYVHAYNEMKKIFEKESTTGTFPRLYRYNGVSLHWNNISESYKMGPTVINYFKDYDIEHKTKKLEQFRTHLREISYRHNKTTIIYRLDGFDYSVLNMN